MTKLELAQRIAGHVNGVTAAIALAVLSDAVIEIADAMERGEAVSLRGLGTFSSKPMPPRKVRNPATGKQWIQPASRKVTFKASREILATKKPAD